MDDNKNNIMGADSGGEAIVICIDDSSSYENFYFQLEAVKAYANYKIKSHPRTVVGAITMSPLSFHLKAVLHPTHDLDKFVSRCRDIRIGVDNLDVDGAITNCLFLLNFSFDIPKGVQKRIVMFVAGRYMSVEVEYANRLVKLGVGVDVVILPLGGEFKLKKKRLKAFVDALNVNGNGNSRIINIEEGLSVSNLLSSFMAGDEHKTNKKKKKRKANKMKNEHKAKKMKPSVSCALHCWCTHVWAH